MQTFTHHLFNEGYLKDANFMHKHTFDSAHLRMVMIVVFLRFAALKFGRDRHEIAK